MNSYREEQTLLTFNNLSICFIHILRSAQYSVVCKDVQRQAAHRHEDRDNHGQQALQTSRFLHVITPFFRFVFIPKHWPPIPHVMTPYV